MENAIQNKETQTFKLSSTSLLPYAALVLAVLFWGGSFPAIRVAVSQLHPQAVMFCRMTIACLIMAPFIKKLKPAAWDRRDLKLLIPMVLLQPCFYFFLESNALKLTTSSQAGVISAFVPILVTLGAWLFLSEKINSKIIQGLVVSVVGVAALTLCGETGTPGDNPILGNSLEFAAMACAAGNMLLVKRMSEKYNSWTLTGMQFLVGLIFFSPGILHLIKTPAVLLRLDLMAALIFLGVCASVGAFGLYNWSMSKIPASRASVFINLVPAIAVFLGWTLLGEALSPGQIAGALLVGFGVFISQKKSKV